MKLNTDDESVQYVSESISQHAILPWAAVSFQKEAFESYVVRNQKV
jgi:hypothetical protein